MGSLTTTKLISDLPHFVGLFPPDFCLDGPTRHNPLHRFTGFSHSRPPTLWSPIFVDMYPFWTNPTPIKGPESGVLFGAGPIENGSMLAQLRAILVGICTGANTNKTREICSHAGPSKDFCTAGVTFVFCFRRHDE